MAQENDDVARKLEELRRRRAELESRRREVEAAKTHNGETETGPSMRGPQTATGGPRSPSSKKRGVLVGLVVICVAVAAAVVYLVMRPPKTPPQVEVAERQATPDAEAEAARIREEQQQAIFQARLDSLAAVADSLSRAAGRADELEKELDDVQDEQEGLRRQLEEERRRRESEAREKERLEQERERLARELSETQTTAAGVEEEAARAPEPSAQDAEARRTEEPVQVASLTEGEDTAAEPSGTGESRDDARLAGLAELDAAPRPERRVDAAQLARERSIPVTSGRVLLRVLVGPSGAVEDVQVVRSLTEVLDQIAVEAMRGWTFTPPTAGGQPVRAWIRVPVVF